jgi:nicotinamidase-related amidase
VRVENRAEILKRTTETFDGILDLIEKLPVVKLRSLQSENTAMVIIDMVNGFTKEGSLKSSRIEEIIPEVARLSRACDSCNIKKLAFSDCHIDESPEFTSYPKHCMQGSFEAEIVEEIKEVGGYTLLEKNSTNGFLEEKFQVWLKENKNIDTFIIAGDCTDICIEQFSITLKTWFNMQNMKSRVIVPLNTVETYDLGLHYGDMMNVFAIFKMLDNGIEVITRLDYYSPI